MKYLGLDLGNRTCGVAVSDSLGMIATSYTVIRFFEKDTDTCLKELLKIIEEKEPSKIVLGYPLSLDGSISDQTKYVLEFKEKLETALNKPDMVILQDERLTTMQVNKVMIDADVSRNKRKQVVDALAATLILQSYLDTIR